MEQFLHFHYWVAIFPDKHISLGSITFITTEAVARRSSVKKVFSLLARFYLMTLYVIFPIHVNFPFTSRCVLKAIHKKNDELFYVAWESFFSKRRFYDIVHACFIWLVLPFYHDLFLFFMFLYLSFINYFCGSMFYTRVFYFQYS